MNTVAKVYIVIVNYNGWSDTIECLESVYKNDYQHYQVIVIDNQSTDDSIRMIQRWCDGDIDVLSHLEQFVHPLIKKPVRYSYIDYDEGFDTNKKVNNDLIIIRNSENNGFAAGNNIAIKYAMLQNDFEYIWLLNNDTVIECGSLVDLVAGFEEHPDCAAVGSKIMYYDNPHILQSIGSVDHATVIKDSQTSDYGQYDQDMAVDDIMGASLLVHKKAIDDVGMMPEQYFLYGEETHWCHDFIKYGFKLYYIHKSRVYHKKSVSTGGSRSPLTLYYQTRNSYILAKNTLDKKTYLRYFLYNTLRRLKRSMKLLFYYNSKLAVIVLLGILDGILGRDGKTRRKL